MKLLHISDLHGDESFVSAIRPMVADVDVVVFSGDITNFDGRKKTKSLLSGIDAAGGRIVAVPGNCDKVGVAEELEERGISVDRRFVDLDGFRFCGMGGSLPCPGRTPNEYSEAEFEEALGKLTVDAPRRTVLVIHQPPYGTNLDRINSGAYVGSHAVRAYIERSGCIVCLGGHIHESAGFDRLGDTVVVNAGPARQGSYVLIQISDEAVEVNHESI